MRSIGEPHWADTFRRMVSIGDLVAVQVRITYGMLVWASGGPRRGQTEELEGIFLGATEIDRTVALFTGFTLLTPDGPVDVIWGEVAWAALRARLSEAQG